jgi:fructokinase
MALRSEYNIRTLKGLIQNGQFREVLVDVNIRKPFYSKKSVVFALENATIVKISDEELSTVSKLAGFGETDYKAFAKILSKEFVNLKNVIITLGAKGSYVYDVRKSAECFCPVYPTDVVSTVGAGDSFSAAFLHKLFLGDSVSECLSHASKVASFVVSNYDAIPDYNPNKI